MIRKIVTVKQMYWTSKESESDRNKGDKSKCQKTVRNISLNIDLQIFSHNQSKELSHSKQVSYCNQSPYSPPDD